MMSVKKKRTKYSKKSTVSPQLKKMHIEVHLKNNL